MPSPPMVDLLHRLHNHAGTLLDAVSPLDCAHVLGVDGICASLIDVDKGLIVWRIVWCGDDISEALNRLRYRFAEGPGVQSVLRNTAVLVPALSSPSVQARWPSYASAALTLGVHAIFAFPLRRMNGPYGAIVAHRLSPGFLRSIDDAKEFANAAARVLVPPHPSMGETTRPT